jgi:tetratricopeptide (TPR) repeat protein
VTDVRRALGREDDAAGVLAEGLKAVPDDPTLVHALGLLRVREKTVADALPLLERASTARPESARFAHVYAVALHSTGRAAEATAVMQKALERAPYDPDLLSGLAAFGRSAGQLLAARGYAQRLAAVAPEDARVPELLRGLSPKQVTPGRPGRFRRPWRQRAGHLGRELARSATFRPPCPTSRRRPDVGAGVTAQAQIVRTSRNAGPPARSDPCVGHS